MLLQHQRRLIKICAHACWIAVNSIYPLGSEKDLIILRECAGSSMLFSVRIDRESHLQMMRFILFLISTKRVWKTFKIVFFYGVKIIWKIFVILT